MEFTHVPSTICRVIVVPDNDGVTVGADVVQSDHVGPKKALAIETKLDEQAEKAASAVVPVQEYVLTE